MIGTTKNGHSRKGGGCIVVTLFSVTILTAAVGFDLLSKKIPNRLILAGYLTGWIYLITQTGPKGIALAAFRASWPILTLYLLFLIGAVGAGDIKLLSVLSVFLTARMTGRVLLFSFLAAAVYSGAKMLLRRELMVRLFHFADYVRSCVVSRQLLTYETFQSEGSYLHFSVFILIGYLAALCFSQWIGG